MPAPTAVQVKSYVNNSYNQIAPELTRTLSGELSSILPSLPSLKGQNISQTAEEIAQSASGDILNSLGKIQDSSQIAQTIANGLVGSIEASSTVNPNLEDVNLSGIYKQINKASEKIAQQHLGNLENYAALKGLSDTIELSSSKASELIISDEAKNYADESEPINPEETAKKIQEHTGLFSQNYRHQLELQAGSLLATGKKPTLEDVKKAKEEAYQKAYTTIEAHLRTRESSQYQEHLRDFSQNVLPMLGYRPLTPNQVEEIGLGAAQPKLTAFLKKTKFSAAGVGLALASSPRAQKEAFYSLLVHNRNQFENDFKDVSNQVKTLKAKGKLSYGERKTFIDARKRYAVLFNARNFATNNPGKFQTYIDTFQSMEAGYRASWASQRARAVMNAFTGRYPAVPAPTVISTKARDIFMSRGFFGALAFKRGTYNVNPAKALMKVGKGANPEFAVLAAAAGPLISGARKIVKAGLAGLFGLGMYFLALGKAVFTGFVIGAMAGGTAGAIAGGIIGFQIGLALAPFTFGLSIPVFTALGIVVGGTAGAFLGGAIGGMIAYGLYTGNATATTSGVGVGAGAIAGAGVGGTIGFFLGSLTGPFAIVLAPLGALIGGMIGAYVGAAIGGSLGYLYGHYVVGTLGAQAAGALTGAAIGTLILPGVGTLIGAAVGWLATGGWVHVKNFFAGAFGTTGATAGGIIGAITGTAASIFSSLASAVGASLGGIASIGSAIWGGLAGLSVPSFLGFAAIGTPVGIGLIATVGLITTSATLFNSEGTLGEVVSGDNQFYTITKIALPTELRNEDLDTIPRPEITFTITLKAKDVNLNNISIIDNLTVNGEHFNSPIYRDKNTRLISEICAGPTGGELAASAEWSCEFTITTGLSWTDSLVTNVVNVQATPEGETHPTIDSATATVLIGEPILVCGIIELQGDWSEAEKTSVDGVCSELGRSRLASSLLQNAGTVFLVKVASGSLGDGVCGTVDGANTVSISCDMSGVNFAKYVIIHELGHVIGNFNGEVYNAFLNSGAYASEGLVPTYPFDIDSANESFAEMIADYVISKRYNFLSREWSGYPGGVWVNPGPGWATFKNDWPRHYNFAKSNIFGGVEY